MALQKIRIWFRLKTVEERKRLVCTYLTTKLQKIALQKIEKTEINGH